jgi:hypothetical protein
MNILPTLLWGAILLSSCLAADAQTPPATDSAAEDRARAVRGSFATYGCQLRRPDGHVDTQRLLSELLEIRANTYHWVIYYASTDWEDLQQFLPLAREKGIRVWVCLVPPSESPPHPKMKHYSEPFRLNFERWAVEIAKLSLREPNLTAWCIDDFTDNIATGSLGVERMRNIIGEARKINPKLAFMPCAYYNNAVHRLVKDYRGLYDAIEFPYLHESAGRNLTDPSLVEDEVKTLKRLVGPSVPIIVSVYATGHSQFGETTPEYVRQVMLAGKRCADGVQVYCHQDRVKEWEKYRIARDLFREWSGAAPASK